MELYFSCLLLLLGERLFEPDLLYLLPHIVSTLVTVASAALLCLGLPSIEGRRRERGGGTSNQINAPDGGIFSVCSVAIYGRSRTSPTNEALAFAVADDDGPVLVCTLVCIIISSLHYNFVCLLTCAVPFIKCSQLTSSDFNPMIASPFTFIYSGSQMLSMHCIA